MAKASIVPIKKLAGKPANKSGIKSKILVVSETPVQKLKFSIYGRSGTGKTRLASTFPKPAIILATEDGTASVKNVKQLDMLPINKIEDLASFCTMFRGEGGYKTVILDTATKLQDLVLMDVLGLDHLPPQLSWGIATREQWGQVANVMKGALREVLNLDAFIVVNSQERTFTPGDESSDVVDPHVTSALSPSVVGYLQPEADYVCQTYIQDAMVKKKKLVNGKEKIVTERALRFCLRTGPDPVYATKFRVVPGVQLPEYVVNPTYEKLKSLIIGEKIES